MNQYRKYLVIGANPQEYIPWGVLTPHEAQAEKKHGGQTLERLAQRGALSWQEIYAVINDVTWAKAKIPPMDKAKKAVLEHVAAWEAAT